MVSRPTGTVTFLFTDVERSTALWRDHPDDMSESLARHDAIVKSAIEDRDGYLFSTGGDGFGAAFSRAADAVDAARAAQQALSAASWPGGAVIRVRMGLHTGEVEERDGDYFGTPVNVASRLMSTSRGGEVLLSGVTADLVAGRVELVAAGERALRDVAEPVRVFGLSGTGLTTPDREAAPGSPAADLVGFGRFVVDLPARELRRDGAPVPIEPQVFDVLRHLIVHHERAVPKAELLNEIWGDQFVSESALTTRVKSVRQAVGDDGRRQEVIRTVHGHGYQFIAPIESVDGRAGNAPMTQGGPAGNRWRSLSVAPEFLIERESARTALADAWREANDGDGRAVVVRGDAGMGKTALVQTFLDGLDPSTSRISVARCLDLSTPRPLGPIVDLLVQLDHNRSDAIPSPVDGAGALIDIGARSPSVVVAVVEDVHWADDATLDALAVLARALPGSRTLLVLTARETEIHADHPILGVLADLRGSGATMIDLEPISPAGLADWARRLGIHVPDIHRRSGGNALLAGELLAAPAEEVPGGVRDAVLARLARLSPRARGAVETLAMSPGPVHVDLAAAVLGDEIDALPEAERGGIVVLLGDAVAFRHELVRAATHESVPALGRIRLHRKFHDHLAGRGDPTRTLHHAAEAMIPEVVLELGPVAARHAAEMESHRQSCEHYGQVLRYADRLDGVTEATLRAEYAYQLYLIWELHRAEREAETAVSLWQQLDDPVGLGSVLTTLGRIQLFTGDGAAVSICRRAVELLEPHGAGTELARAYCELAGALVIGDRFDEAQEPARRAHEIARETGAVGIEALAFNYVALVAHAAGESAERDLRRAFELARTAKPREYSMRVLANLVVDLWSAGRWPEAADLIRLAEREVSGVDHTASVVNLRLQTAHVALVMGQIDEALAKLDWIAAVDRTGSSRLEAEILRHRVLMRADRGRWATDLHNLWAMHRPEGDEVADTVVEMLGSRSRYPILLLMVVMAETAWRTDDPDLASDVATAYQVQPFGAPWPTDRSELALYLHLAGVDPPIPMDDIVEPFASVVRGEPDSALAFERAGRLSDAAILRERGI